MRPASRKSGDQETAESFALGIQPFQLSAFLSPRPCAGRRTEARHSCRAGAVATTALHLIRPSRALSAVGFSRSPHFSFCFPASAIFHDRLRTKDGDASRQTTDAFHSAFNIHNSTLGGAAAPLRFRASAGDPHFPVILYSFVPWCLGGSTPSLIHHQDTKTPRIRRIAPSAPPRENRISPPHA